MTYGLIKRRTLSSGFSLALALCGLLHPGRVAAQDTIAAATPVDPAQTRAVEQWIGSHAIPLKSVHAGSGFDDLMPLENVLKDAQVIAFGEATHGTREFFQTKHRMLEFLVTHMNVRTFAIEAGYAPSLLVDDYVVYGKGNPDSVLAGIGFWTWDTHEVLDMIKWMRQYNSTVPESQRVHFAGFDIQNNAHGVDVVHDYLDRVDPSEGPAADSMFALLPKTQKEVFAFMGRADDLKTRDAANLKALEDRFASHEQEYVQKSSQSDFKRATKLLHTIVQYNDAYSSPLFNKEHPDQRTGVKRDKYMAENILTMLREDGPGARTMIWAHNGHIEAGSGMGEHLRKALGKGYYAFGFDFDRGSFQSVEFLGSSLTTLTSGKGIGSLREFTLPPAPKGSVAWYLEGARQGKPFTNYIIDFRSAPTTGPVAEWLSSPHAMTSIGSMFSTKWSTREYMGPTTLRKQFDGVIFIESTTRARPNPTGMRGKGGSKGVKRDSTRQ